LTDYKIKLNFRKIWKSQYCPYHHYRYD